MLARFAPSVAPYKYTSCKTFGALCLLPGSPPLLSSSRSSTISATSECWRSGLVVSRKVVCVHGQVALLWRVRSVREW